MQSNNCCRGGKSFPGLSSQAMNNADLYAAEKEVYLGSLCEVDDKPKPWQFWMVMLKNGNYDTNSGLCPENGKRVLPFKPGRFPCPGNDCMNQPLLHHNMTSLSSDGSTMRGGFSGSYELGSQGDGLNSGNSYYEVIWEKKVGNGSWEFKHKLKTSKLYSWLMLYLRSDDTKGFSGGYHYDTRGMLKTVTTLRLIFNFSQYGSSTTMNKVDMAFSLVFIFSLLAVSLVESRTLSGLFLHMMLITHRILRPKEDIISRLIYI